MNKLNKILSEGFANIDEITADACYQLDCVADDSLNKDSISPLLDLMKQSHDRKAEADSMLIFDGEEYLRQCANAYGSPAVSDLARAMQSDSTMPFQSLYLSNRARQYMGAQNMGMGGLGSMVGNSFAGSLWQ